MFHIWYMCVMPVNFTWAGKGVGESVGRGVGVGGWVGTSVIKEIVGVGLGGSLVGSVDGTACVPCVLGEKTTCCGGFRAYLMFACKASSRQPRCCWRNGKANTKVKNRHRIEMATARSWRNLRMSQSLLVYFVSTR